MNVFTNGNPLIKTKKMSTNYDAHSIDVMCLVLEFQIKAKQIAAFGFVQPGELLFAAV